MTRVPMVGTRKHKVVVMKDLAPSPHASYHESVERRIRAYVGAPSCTAAVKNLLPAILVLWYLDLEPARGPLQRCYARSPRGGRPWDPIILLRSYLLGLLLKSNITDLVNRLRAEPLLRIVVGLPDLVSDGERKSPGVGTFYDFLHRMHDGPHDTFRAGVVRPSQTDRRRVREPRKLESKAAKKTYGKKVRGRRKRKKDAEAEAAKAETESMALTEKIVRELQCTEACANPQDYKTRLNTLLLELAVKVSAEKGLVGETKSIVASGDGSALPTGASGHGKKDCGHGRRERCDCPRRYADPDAQRGFDAFRKCYYFGHHFYEIGTGAAGHDLPLFISLDAANVPENGMALRALDSLNKLYSEQTQGWHLGTVILDAGHDNQATHRYLIAHGATPVIPLSCSAPALHPTRPEVKLSPKGIPLCEGDAEMAAWGSAGEGRPLFICPVKAGKLARCPMAPKGSSDWACHPEMKYGPAISVKTADNPRLFPAIQRNSKKYAELYRKRTESERSNSVKKETFDLLGAHHRRKSFWFFRLIGIAILQHAKAWVAGVDIDEFLALLLGTTKDAKTA